MLSLGSDRLKISRKRQKLPGHACLIFLFIFFVYQDFIDIISVVRYAHGVFSPSIV